MPLALFTTVTLTPALLIALGAVFGGVWVLGGLLYMTTFTAILDELTDRVTPATDGDEFPAATGLSAGLAIVHFGLLGLTVYVLTQPHLNLTEKVALYVAAGLFFGQVSNANAHELIHRPRRWMHKLGMWVYISLLFGHHTSAHPLVHHVHVGTRKDPSTARLGESFYRFAIRAWRGSFRDGWAQESYRSQLIDRPAWGHPYLLYGMGSAMCIGIALMLGSWTGAGIYIGLCLMAQTQLLMSDYVQHYGLMRREVEGKPEPVNIQHSWNSPHPISSALTMNAPRHSDHHTRPGQTYLGLALPAASDAPMLPRSLPVMAFIALNPRRWRRIMDPLAARWENN